MKRVTSFIFAILAVWVGRASACEFCTLHNGLGQYNNNGDFFSITERYTSASTAISGGQVLPAGPNTNGYAIQINTVQFLYQHSYSDDLKGVFSIPYFNKRSSWSTGADGGDVADAASGIGDATAMLRYRAWEGQHNQTFWVYGGFKIPTGAYHYTAPSGPAGTGYFNPDLVLGTGSMDYLLGFAYTQNIGSFSWAFDGLYKVSNEGYDGYQFGNVLNWGLSGYYRLHNNWNAGLGLVSELTASDTDRSGNFLNPGGPQMPGVVPNTGGNVIYGQPTIQYVNQNNYVDLSYQLPVYRYFTGVQIVVDGKIIIAYRHAF